MRFLRSLYINKRLYYYLGGLVTLFVFSEYYPFLFWPAQLCMYALIIAFFVDLLILFTPGKNMIKASRSCTERFSNGDNNKVILNIKSKYPFPVWLRIYDELPDQFQQRDFLIKSLVRPDAEKSYSYILKPTERGEYDFGYIRVFARSALGILERRFIAGQKEMIPTYPSFIQMKKFELLAISNRLSDAGIKKIRRLGHQLEFDHIKEYVKGDDYRTINWKATARRGQLMVNQYDDEKSQQVYSLIDMGRVMKMPFNGMTLLDYAINTSLVISNIAMLKYDKAGLLTFSNQVNSFLPAERKGGHIKKFMQMLYNQTTDFHESNYTLVYSHALSRIKQRSLILLFTNFESLNALQKQINFIRGLSRNHLVCTIFFENEEIESLTQGMPEDTESLYIKTIASKFMYEKRQMVKELQKAGAHPILTRPENLSVATINKYLEFKAKGMI